MTTVVATRLSRSSRPLGQRRVKPRQTTPGGKTTESLTNKSTMDTMQDMNISMRWSDCIPPGKVARVSRVAAVCNAQMV